MKKITKKKDKHVFLVNNPIYNRDYVIILL